MYTLTYIYSYIHMYSYSILKINLKDTKEHILYDSILQNVQKQAKLIFDDRNQNRGFFGEH